MAVWQEADRWLAQVTGCMRWKKARPVVQKELADHLEDQTGALLAAGCEEQAARAAALRQMGDAETVGRQLDAAWRPGRSVALPTLAVALCAAGILCRLALAGAGAQALVKSLAALLLGAAVCFGISRLSMQRLADFAPVAYGIFAALCLVGALWLPTINGRPYFFVARGVSFGTDVLFLLFPVLYTFLVWRQRGRGLWGVATALLWLVPVPILAAANMCLYAGAVSVLCGIALLLGAVYSGQMGCTKRAGLLFVTVACLVGICGCLFLGMAVAPYFWTRLLAWLDPYADPMGMGYLPLAARAVFGECSLFSGASAETLNRLPDVAGSMLVTWCVGRFGFWVLAVIGLLLAALLWCGAKAALAQPSLLGRLTAASVVLVFLSTALFYLTASFGVGMFYSASLPFFGNVSMVTSGLLLGVLLSAQREGALWSDAAALTLGPVCTLAADGSLVIRLPGRKKTAGQEPNLPARPAQPAALSKAKGPPPAQHAQADGPFLPTKNLGLLALRKRGVGIRPYTGNGDGPSARVVFSMVQSLPSQNQSAQNQSAPDHLRAVENGTKWYTESRSRPLVIPAPVCVRVGRSDEQLIPPAVAPARITRTAEKKTTTAANRWRAVACWWGW